VVAHGPVIAIERWEKLDPDGPPQIDWLLHVAAKRMVVLLGAFDPPTNAHLAIAKAASQREDAVAVLGMTKVLLDRPSDLLLSVPERLGLLAAIASEEGFGFFLANRGTYLDVARSLAADGREPTFVVGSDKLEQLADPKFYTEGDAGVSATFSEVRFLVVPRAGGVISRAEVQVMDPTEAFAGADEGEVSGTEVRRRLRMGEPVDELVPPAVALALQGYTAAR
jgi:nicotinic acid mononucleotide adenylyltransferase